MNFHNKILIAIIALGTILGACDSLIFEELEDCPQGVYVKFHTMTPCDVDSQFVGEVSDLILFAFDENGLLVTSVTQHNVILNSSYEVFVPVSDGYYSFIAWTGLNDNFSNSSFTNGVTSKSDVMTKLNTNSGVAANLNNKKVYHGESSVIFLPDPYEYGSVFKHTSINLKEITNRIKLIVEFDETTMKEYNIHALQVNISSANSTLRIDGTMPLNESSVEYPSAPHFDNNSSTWNFTMLKLQTGYNNKLNIVYTGNDKEGETVFDGDLIAGILLMASEQGVNLDCENDFTIKVLIKDYCVDCWTHFSCSIYVNDWHIHSYSTEL